ALGCRDVVVAEGGQGLAGPAPDDVLVVHHGHAGPDEGPHPEDPLLVPRLLVVVHHGGPEAPGRVDAGAGDGDGGEVHDEHREPDGQRRQHGHVGVPRLALRVGGGEDGVDEHEGADDLRGEPGALGVSRRELVGAAAVARVLGAVHGPDEAGPAHGAEALPDHVEQRADEGDLAGEEEAEGDGRVDVAAGDAGGAVDQDEDHAAEGPRDAEDSRAAAADGGVGLALVADDGGDGDVDEEERGGELGDDGAPERPLAQLAGVDERRRGRVTVVLGGVVVVIV
uniref:Uncharacterized protein n=1 Tax=Triticum urartu TaxID=4572 RepID=A0A8R7Q183_TRIUA